MLKMADRHPNLTAWGVLAVGMLVILAWSARDVSLTFKQWLALGGATVLLAGLCAWIISWEADEDDVWGDDERRVDGAAEAGADPETTGGPGAAAGEDGTRTA